MQKIIIVLAGLMLLTATAAQAEHKLLITDILNSKQFEGQVRYEYAHGNRDFTEKSTGEKGEQNLNLSEMNLSLAAGLGHGLEISAFLPYVLSEREKEELAGESNSSKIDGIGDLAVELKYLVIGGEEKPLNLVAGLGVKFDTAGRNNAGTGTTNTSPFVAASYNLGHHYVPYGGYRATIRNNNEQDTHTLTLGLEKEFNHTFTIDAKVDANLNTASDDVKSNQNYLFELGAYIQTAHNLYLLPTVGYTLSSSYTDTAHDVKVDSGDGFKAGIALYYLY